VRALAGVLVELALAHALCCTSDADPGGWPAK